MQSGNPGLLPLYDVRPAGCAVWPVACTLSSQTVTLQSSNLPIDTRYSHWHPTGVGPARPSQTGPLDDAIAFEQYRLMIISAWPESEDKQERLRSIDLALRRLELARDDGARR